MVRDNNRVADDPFKTVEDIIRDRRNRRGEYKDRAKRCANDDTIRCVSHEYVAYQMARPGKILFELYRGVLGEFYLEAKWIISYNSFARILDTAAIEFKHETSHPDSHYLLLVWESDPPVNGDIPIAKSFLSIFDAVRLSAYLPKAASVAFIKGNTGDIGFNITEL